MGSDWVAGGRRLGFGGGGGVGWGREGGRTLRTYKVITNTRNKQSKMIMGNIIVCLAGPNKFKY